MNYGSAPSPNCAALFAGAARVTYHSRPAAWLAFLAGGATKIGAGLGGFFGLLNLKDQISFWPLPTLLCSGPKNVALFPASELTR